MALIDRAVGISCTHLGGDKSVSWVIEVDRGSRGEPTGEVAEVQANGCDVYATLNLEVLFARSNCKSASFATLGSHDRCHAFKSSRLSKRIRS